MGASGRPEPSESAEYYHFYINLVEGDDVVAVMEPQMEETLAFYAAISEEDSLRRYEAGKWSIREVLSHLSDTERSLSFRAFWFARGFETALPSFEQETAVAGAQADQLPWAAHLEEFRAVREATIFLLRHLPAEAWLKTGVASGNRFTVRSLAYVMAGHVIHHGKIVRERYR